MMAFANRPTPSGRQLHTLGDAPIEPRFAEMMQRMTYGIDAYLNMELEGAARALGFVLMIWPFDEEMSRCNMISNCESADDVVAWLKAMIKSIERNGTNGG